ncbi:MAG: hypothetical protein WCD37_03605 [Chloroflexia bacterium]
MPIQNPENPEQMLYTQEERDQAVREVATQQAITAEATRLGIADTALAASLVDATAITYDEAGNPTNLEPLLQAAHTRLQAALVPNQAQPPASITRPINPPRSPAGGPGGKPTFSRAQLTDTAFFAKNEAAIMDAMRDGRIRD